MKTYGNLWPQITSYEALYLAYRRARCGKRNSPAMARFSYDLEGQLKTLQRQLLDETYQPSSYYAFSINDPKPRRIYAAAFRDRVVHHSLVAAIEPIFDARMIDDTYACRVGGGTHAALDALDRHWRLAAKGGPAYVLRIDVRRYFFNIDHAILADMICSRLREGRVIRLVRKIIDSLSTGGAPGIGIPIGNLTSQLFANVYLSQLDQFAKHTLRIRHYLRYMDDVAILHHDKGQLRAWLMSLRSFLRERLRLETNQRTTVFPASDGIPWLGWRVLEPGRRRLSRRMVVRAARRLRNLADARRDGTCTPQQFRQRFMAWIAHAEHGDTWQLRDSLFRSIDWSI